MLQSSVKFRNRSCLIQTRGLVFNIHLNVLSIHVLISMCRTSKTVNYGSVISKISPAQGTQSTLELWEYSSDEICNLGWDLSSQMVLFLFYYIGKRQKKKCLNVGASLKKKKGNAFVLAFFWSFYKNQESHIRNLTHTWKFKNKTCALF